MLEIGERILDMQTACETMLHNVTDLLNLLSLRAGQAKEEK